MKQKLSPQLLEMLEQQTLPDPVPVIIQTEDGLQQADQQMLDTVGGSLEDDLWIIKGYSASIPARALRLVVLSPRVTLVHYNADVSS